MEYFATSKASSKATEDIDKLVKWYQTDSNTRLSYMTWQEEIDEAVDMERERADKEKARADAAESRANKYEKILKEHGLL